MSDKPPVRPAGATAHDPVLDSVGVGVLTIDAEGRLVEANDAALAMFGHTRGMLLGENATKTPRSADMRPLPPSIRPLAILVLTSMSTGALACGNDPLWRDTLRCKLFPNDTPPPTPAAPSTPAELGAFTRVELPWRNETNRPVRCVDGTRAILYVDEANDPASNDWLFLLQGGGSCKDGQTCLDAYLDPNEQGEMGTARDLAMQSFPGIHRPIAGNAFADYHRVRVKKCGYDRYNGNAVATGVEATIDSDLDGDAVQGETIVRPDGLALHEGETLRFDLHHLGARTLLHALDTLRDGLAYPTWRDDGSGITNDRVQLPPLADAERVLFVGHSGAAHGLMHRIDRLADHVRRWTRSDDARFRGDVRALFDAQLLPSIENEASFNDHLDGDLFDALTLCRAPCEGGPPLHYGYDGMGYYGSGGVGQLDYFDGPYVEWNTALDASCLAAHPDDAWRCVDRWHVLYNHVETPFLVREDLSDPNAQHNDDPAGPGNRGHRPFWAEHRLEWCDDPEADAPCPPRLSQADFRARVERQATHFADDFATRSEEGAATGTVPTVFLWLPDCGQHAGTSDNDQFFRVELESASRALAGSLHDFAVEFMNAPRENGFDGRVDGAGDWVSVCS